MDYKQRRRSSWEEARASLYSASSFNDWLKAANAFLLTPEFSTYRPVKFDANKQPVKFKWLHAPETIHDKIDLTHDDLGRYHHSVSLELATLYEGIESGNGPILFTGDDDQRLLADVVKMQIAVGSGNRVIYGFVLRFVRLFAERKF